MKKRWFIVLATAALLAGCDRRSAVSNSTASSSSNNPSTSAQTQPATGDADARPAAATAPAQPAGATIFIKDSSGPRAFFFPAARLRLTKEGDKYLGVLYTDDPKSAIDPDYSGNSFFLRMTLDVEDPRKLGGADWQYAPTSSDHEESGDGLFLSGNRFRLQPVEIGASFRDQSARTVEIALDGQFRRFDTNQTNSAGTLVQVHGEFTATIEIVK